MFTPQQPQRAPARHVPIERHLGGRERLSKKRLRRRDTAVATQQKVDRLALLVDGPVKVVPLRLDRNVCLVDSPRGADPTPSVAPGPNWTR
jgi:hypothetical protein